MQEKKRWNVTYTKHIKQKRKVYHDGFLELHCATNKVLLYDDSEKLLGSRFLKKDDLVECGVTLVFESHLVDIGDPTEVDKPTKGSEICRNDGKTKENSGIYGQNCRKYTLVKRKNRLKQQYMKGLTNVSHQHTRATVGGLSDSKGTPDEETATSSEDSASSKSKVSKDKPLCRDVFQILSSLRRPSQESIIAGNPFGGQTCQSSDGLRSVTLDGPSNITGYVYPDCKVEAPNSSASSSPLAGKEGCKTPVFSLIKSAPKDFQDLGASNVGSFDNGHGLTTQNYINESFGCDEEDKPDLGFGSNEMQIRDHVDEFCSQFRSDDIGAGKDGMETGSRGFESNAGCIAGVPGTIADKTDGDSESDTLPGGIKIAEEIPSFDLGIEI